MSSPSDSLKSSVHSLFDSLLVRVFGQAVAEVVLSSYLPYCYSASGNLVLKPQLIQFNVPNLSRPLRLEIPFAADESVYRTIVC